MDNERVAAIRAALDAATQGEWKWHSVLSLHDLPDSAMSAGDLRVYTPTPDKFYDGEIAFILQPMKSGAMLLRKTDGDLIANAPTWLRELLAENARLQKVVEAAREIVDDADRPQLARNWATDRLMDALADYDSGEGGE
jgi:hypothetical protein